MQVSGSYNLRFGSTAPWSTGINPITNTKLNPLTRLFRNDIDWDVLTETIKTQFPQRTDIYCYGGSDGSEAYSLAMKLIDKFGEEKAEKFFPIKSIDLEQKNIDMANSGLIGIQEKGIHIDTPTFMNNIKNKKFSDYFKLDRTQKRVKHFMDGRFNLIRFYKVAKELREKVEFKQGDILKDTGKEFEKPCVVMFRNAWYLLGKSNIEKLANNLSSNLKKGSLVIIGSTDNTLFRDKLSSQIDKLLINKGFKPLEISSSSDYIFEKQ